MTVRLRDYQEDLIAGIRGAFAARKRRVLAVSPTGSGKTITFAYLTQATAARGNTVYIVAHRQEIVDQISGALDIMGVRHGRIQPGHTHTSDPVQVAMIQTLARRLDRVPQPKFLIVDEAHHGVAGTWATVTAAWPDSYILGVTATPERLDGRGLGAAFDDMILGPSVRSLIERGFLARYRYLAPPVELDLSHVRQRSGDYAVDELAAAVDKAVITGSAVGHYRQHLDGRPAIAFCVTVEHAEHVAAEFQAAGYRAASVDGAMKRGDRRDRIAAIGDGRLHVLTSCELISEGVDVPVVAGAILLRPTKSLGLFLQQVGRALRPKPDGSDAVILDHVGNFSRHGLPDADRVWSLDARKRRPGTAGATQCEVCYRVFATDAPGWRNGQECREPEQPEDCVLAPREAAAGGRELPAVVDGTLAEVAAPVAPSPAVVPEWSGGVCIATGPYKQVVRLARTEDQLREVARARGYDRRWVARILSFRHQRAEPAEVPFMPVPAVPAAARVHADELAALLA